MATVELGPIIRGDTRSFLCGLYQPADIDFEDLDTWVTFKRDPADSDANAVLQKYKPAGETEAEGITVLAGAAKTAAIAALGTAFPSLPTMLTVIRVALSIAEAALLPAVKLHYDVQVQGDDDVTTVQQGYLRVTQDITLDLAP